MKTLDSLGALAADVRDGVLRLGRAGGALLLGLAVPAGLGAAWAFSLASEREARLQLSRVTDLRALGTLLAGLALALVVLGVLQALRPRAPRDRALAPLDPAELMCLARETARPFHVCVRCRRVWRRDECFGPCPQCGSTADCLEVKSDGDLSMVEAAIQ